MAKRKQGGFELVASMPWQAGIACGLIGYIGIQYGTGWLLGSSSNPFLSAFGGIAASGIYKPLAWLVLIACWLAALASFVGSCQRRHLLDTRTSLESLAAVGWRHFELLVGEAFRREGYAVEETGLGGADGGIDLILRKDGRLTLVQCKQWRRQQVGVNVVREMAGLLAHHQAYAVKIVSTGTYTRDAQQFAQGKPIELVSGQELLRMIRAVQHAPAGVTPAPGIPPNPVPASPAPRTANPFDPGTEITPACPTCGKPMIARRNRHTGAPFWGCTGYPGCRGTREKAL